MPLRDTLMRLKLLRWLGQAMLPLNNLSLEVALSMRNQKIRIEEAEVHLIKRVENLQLL